MKLHTIVCAAVLGMGPAAGVAAQDSSGIVGEKGIIGEKRGGGGDQGANEAKTSAGLSQPATNERAAGVRGAVLASPEQRLGTADKAPLREGAAIAPSRGLPPRPSAVGPLGDAGWAGQSDEKLPHKEPKGPDKTPAGLGQVDRLAGNPGWVGKSEDKPPKDPEPKDPKGPDKLGSVALKAQTVEAAATRTRSQTVQQATRVRSADAAQRAAKGAVQTRP